MSENFEIPKMPETHEEVIRKRLLTYEAETKPVLNFYAGLVTTVDALQPPVKVLQDIISAIWNAGHEAVASVA